MAKNKALDDYWKYLADEASEGGDDGALWTPPDIVPDPARAITWSPDLNPTQQKIFDDMSMTILAYGEKGSGKSVGCLEKGVRHCYETHNALWLMITVTISVGTEGVWHDLQDLTLPRWRDGNRYPDWLNGEQHPHAGELIDEGIGLHFTESKLDPNSKDRHIWVFNKFGTWSKILLKSIPHPSQVETRVKGPAPSMVYVDELTNCEGHEYYTWPAAQLTRRRMTYAPMQYIASCNPRGPSHWVYKHLIDPDPEEKGDQGKSDIAVYHVPLSENVHRVHPDYSKRLNNTLKDPYERRRLIDGEWVDMPAGDAIFKEYFVPEIHVKGDALKSIGLLPLPGYPIIVGHDPGPKNYSIHFEQRIPTLDEQRPIIINVFDELNFVGKYASYESVVRKMIRRMVYWNEKQRWKYSFEHIADEAAFTMKNSNGSFDNLEIQRLCLKFGWKILMRPCPKGSESQPQRVQMVIDYLLMEALYVSAICEHTTDMLRLLPSKKLKEGEYDPYAGIRPQKCAYLHPFDSMSYPMWKYHVRPKKGTRTDEVQKARVIFAGSGR